jgi:hypothetical protein
VKRYQIKPYRRYKRSGTTEKTFIKILGGSDEEKICGSGHTGFGMRHRSFCLTPGGKRQGQRQTENRRDSKNPQFNVLEDRRVRL